MRIREISIADAAAFFGGKHDHDAFIMGLLFPAPFDRDGAAGLQ